MTKASILIVEDEAVVANDLAEKLRELDYAICATAEDGAKAVTLARERRPDLVLMDIRLAGPMDGVEAAKRIRRECDLPVIYLTAHSDPATLERAKLTEPFGYILKPFEEVELETQIQIALHKHRTERKLRESEERFRRLAAATFEGIAISEGDRIIELNDQLARLLGYHAPELIGRELVSLVPPEDQGRALRNLQARVESDLEHRLCRKDGSLITVESHSQTVSQQGRTLRFTAIRDITERKRAEAALAQAHRELQIANHELQNTNEELQTTAEELKVANEELRTTTEELQIANEQLEQRVLERTAQLRALAGQLTQSEERERRRIAKILHDHLQQLMVGARLRIEVLRTGKKALMVRKELRRIEKLLDESVEVSRGLSHELGSPVLHEAGLAAGLDWLARWMHKNHGLSVHVEADDAAEPLDEDVKVLLYQSVRELLFNVVKHARVKRARLKMGLGEDDEVEIVVSDRGKGFESQPFNQGRGTSAGFGLFSIRERLAWLGGRMEVESQPGQGSRFRLCAPLHEQPARKVEGATRPAAAPAKPLQRSKSRPASRPAPRRRKGRIRVLLADDHAILREGLARLLKEQPDLEVVGLATDGQEALDQAAKLQPDVVIMDVTMPRMDGVEATRQIRAAWPHIKVIGLTMHADDSPHDAMLAAGAVKSHVKSGPTQELISAIRAAVA